MTRSPFGANRTTGIDPGSTAKDEPRRFRDVTSHNVEVWSFDVATNSRPSGENEIGSTPPVATWTDPSCAPVSVFTNTTDPSSVPTASRRPSGEKAIAVACPLSLGV